MGPDFFQGMDVERESSRNYGRFKALENEDAEELDQEYGAKTVTENIMAQVDQNIEQLLVKQGHMPKEEEISHEKFQEVHDRVQNIENEWEAAFKQKDYEEVEVSDLKVLKNLVSNFLQALEYELKVTNYIDLFHSEISNIEVDENAIRAFLDLEEDSEDSEVGKHLKEVNKKQKYDLEELRAKVEKKLENTGEEFEVQIEEFEDQVEFYKNHVDILEAVGRELEEIEGRTEDEEVEEQAEEARDIIDNCLNLILDLIERKEEVVDNHTQARKLKKNVNRLFLSGL